MSEHEDRPRVRRRFAEIEKPDGKIVKVSDVIEIKNRGGYLEVLFGDEEFGADAMGFASGKWVTYRLRNIEADPA